MGITLTGKTVSSTYDSLLKLTDNDSLNASFKLITDGLGNDTGISINNSGNVNISGTLTVGTRVNTPILQLTGGTGTQGTMSWNADEETVDLIQNGSTLQLGQEIQVHCKNQTGATIPDGTPVYVTGTLGASGRLTIAPMIADGSIQAKYFIGVTTEAIANGDDGKVTTFGKIRGINTAAYSEGQTLWVSATTAGAFVTTRPVAPNLDLEVAIVINSHVNNGTLFVRSSIGHYLGTAHDVNISSVAENDLLVYKTNRWVNTKSIGDLSAANVTLTGYLRGPATFVIDPAAYGDETGLVQILGDLRVDGTTTTINSTTISVSDKNITLAKDAATAGDANGAGITIAGANATLTYLSATDNFTFNKNVNASRFVGPLTGDVTGTVSSLSNHDTDDLDEGTTNLYFTTTRARDAFSAGTGVSIASGVVSIGQSVGTTDDVTFGTVTASLSGNADTASALANARNIAIDGSVTGNADFDGSGNITITTTTNHNHDDRYYTETESDAKYLLNTTDTLDGDLTVTGELTVTGTIDLSNADLNIGSADIIFGTTAGGATRGLIWDVSGSGFLSKLIGGGADGGKVTLYANMDDAITTGNIFEIKDGSTGSLFLGLSHAGILTAGGGTSTQWNTAYSWGDHAGLYLPLASKAADSELFDGLDSSVFIYGSNTSGTIEGIVNDWNAPTKTGFYSSGNAANRWSGTSDWTSILHFKLYDDNNNYASQLGFNTYNNKVFARTNSGGTWTAWDEFITTANIGSQSVSYATSAGTAASATNAGLLDSLDSTQFLRSDEPDVMTGDGAANTYRGVLRINDTGGAKWAGLSFPDDVNAADSAKNNYYFIGRGASISDRVMSFHIPTGGNYESGIQPKFVFASTGADQLMTIQATTGNVFVKGDLGIGTSTPSTYMSGTKGISILNAINPALGLSNGINNWLNYLAGTTYRIWNNTKSEVVTIDLNGNIGIGTNSPVNGGSTARWISIDGTAAYSGGVAYTINGTAKGYHYVQDDFLVHQGAAGVGHKWYANSALKMTMLSNGYLGIGIDNPSYPLDLGNGGTGNSIRARRIWANGTGTDSGFSLNNTLIYENLSSSFVITNPGSYPSTSFCINTSGNVGINTTSPGQKLHVDGNVLFNGGTGASTFNDVNIGGISGWSGGEAHRINFVYGGADNPAIFQTIESHFDGNTSRLRFRNLFDGAPKTDIAMTIMGNGNVGIGIDTPLFNIDVAGKARVKSTEAQTFIFDTTNANGLYTAYRNNGGDVFYIGQRNVTSGSGGSGYDFYTNSGYDMRFFSAGVPTMTLVNGKVGIGTYSPSGKFDVAHDMYTGAGVGVLQAGAYGNINFKGASSQGTLTTQQGITWQVDSYAGSTNYGVQAQIAVGNNGNVGTFMGFFTSDNYGAPPVERIRIQHNGRVGIGTTNPSRILTIQGASGGWSTAPQVAFYDSTVTGNARNWTIGAVSTNYGDFNIASSTAQGGVPETPRLTINKDGVVGIGTASPASYMSGTYGLSILNTTNAALGLSNGTNNWLNYLSGTTYRIWNNNVGEVITILLNGNVGIGKTNPDYKLDIAATEIKATNDILIGTGAYSVNSDYVGMKTTFQSGVYDYMILSGKADGATYVSAKDGEGVYIRGGGNNDNNSIYVPDNTYIQVTTSAFRVSGDVLAYSTSDARLKDNVKPIENAIDKVKAIGGYEFDWNEKQEVYEGHDIGVIAQEVEAIFPELVTTRESGYKAVKYEKLTALLIEAIKEQQKQIDELKAIINGSTK